MFTVIKEGKCPSNTYRHSPKDVVLICKSVSRADWQFSRENSTRRNPGHDQLHRTEIWSIVDMIGESNEISSKSIQSTMDLCSCRSSRWSDWWFVRGEAGKERRHLQGSDEKKHDCVLLLFSCEENEQELPYLGGDWARRIHRCPATLMNAVPNSLSHKAHHRLQTGRRLVGWWDDECEVKLCDGV